MITVSVSIDSKNKDVYEIVYSGIQKVIAVAIKDEPAQEITATYMFSPKK